MHRNAPHAPRNDRRVRRMRGDRGYGRTMVRPSIPGRHIEIFFADADRVVDMDVDDQDPAIASIVVEAIERDDPDDAERILQDGVAGTVRRRPEDRDLGARPRDGPRSRPDRSCRPIRCGAALRLPPGPLRPTSRRYRRGWRLGWRAPRRDRWRGVGGGCARSHQTPLRPCWRTVGPLMAGGARTHRTAIVSGLVNLAVDHV